MSCHEHDDMDVAVQIRKINVVGQPLEYLNYPCPVPFEEVPGINIVRMIGPQGFLRASHRITLDREKSFGNELFYTHREREAISPGTIVALEIPIWPTSINFAPGEGIMLKISGHDMAHPETSACVLTEPEDANVGRHNVFTGGRYKSVLTVPIIPQ